MILEQREREIFAELKDFQRETVNRCCELYANGQNRILVADEVGLGKTLIAKGVIAKLANRHKAEGDDLFKVLYICSNSDIASQNIRKLKIHDGVTVDGVTDTRLSMQHLKIFEQENDEKVKENYIQLIPLTPATSFNVTRGSGSVAERALMFAIIKRLEVFAPYEQELEVLFEDRASASFHGWAKNWLEWRVSNCNLVSGGDYLRLMLPAIQKALDKNNLTNMILGHCKLIREMGGKRISGMQNTLFELRGIFSEISIKHLKPDLVIMDEFQRFRQLINADAESDTGRLTNAFLRSDKVKTLLLSATPHKLYQTLEESAQTGQDEHYREFYEVMDFLFDKDDKKRDFREVWQGFSTALHEYSANNTSILDLKNTAENAMYEAMCRTERLIVPGAAAMYNNESTEKPLRITEQDIQTFIETERLAQSISETLHIPVEYVKSCPYLLSFMEHYKFKDKVRRAVRDESRKAPVKISRKTRSMLFVSQEKVSDYQPLATNNARLDALSKTAFEGNSQNLMWMPPSFPYYEPGGVYKKTQNLSKTLVFSSWEMVPRMIACMLSYEAERLTIGQLYAKETIKQGKNYFAKERFPRGRLQTEAAKNALTSVNEFLVDLYKPLDHIGQSIEQIKKSIKPHIEKRIDELQAQYNFPSRGDLIDVCANMAIASPAICAFRILKDRKHAEEFAEEFRKMFERPEATAIIKQKYGKSDDAYYRNVLKYCVDGNLAAVLDEYAHVLNTSNKESLYNQMKDALAVNTASYPIDTASSFCSNGKKMSMRSHFAAGFYQTGSDEKTGQRKENLRNAFNSPFRPFVLATTSIGQEGLDFHAYARKVVHWNLPHNPIDLEQREGRINRYKCLAIRQNVAKHYKKDHFDADVWNEMFELADKNKKPGSSDLVPYWCLPDGEIKIERIAMMYPLSRDEAAYRRLMKILSLYRVTMGQARQEELLEYLFRNCESETEMVQLFMNLSPFSRAKENESKASEPL